MTHYLLEELKEKLKSDDSLWDFLRLSCLDGMWYWDLEHPEQEWMSPEFWQLFGYDPDSKPHTPDSWFDIINPDDKQTAVENLEKHLADPSHPYDQIVRYRHADGHTIWVRCRGLAVRDETGKPIRLLGAHTDLTDFVNEERAAREEELATVNARLNAVFNAAQGGIVGLNANREVVTLNPPARHMLGGISTEVPFAWPDDIHFLDSADFSPLDASADPINRALAGVTIGGEVHLMTTGNDTSTARYVRVSSALSGEADTDVHTVVALHDVSEQEMNRQQIERQSRLDALGQFTGGIAHDFNNLLSTILYATTLVKDQTRDERSQRLLADTLVSIERGRDLTRRLLAFAKQEPGVPSSFGLRDFFEELSALLKTSVEEHIQVELVPPEEDLLALCDKHMLENAVLNLVLNSRDAILREGQGNRISISAALVTSAEDIDLLTSELRLKKQTDLPDFVKISVTDNGPGMTAEIRRRATDPFFSTKSDNKSTGLGLSTVFGFAQQSGGKMRITSEPGAGTTVSLLLPAGDAAIAAPPAPAPDAAGTGRGESVLLVEDETALLSMMTDQLEHMGYQVAAVSSGTAALQLLKSGLKVDALISDVVMPGGVGGFELARELRALHPETAVILLSGYAGYTADKYQDLDAVFLHKPCLPAVLDAKLRELLSDKQPREPVSPTGT